MDTAVSVLQSIYDVYKTIKDGQDQFQATYGRMEDLLAQFQSMEASETLVQSKLLDKYVAIARDFLAYLTKYKKRKFLSKVIHQSEMLAEIDGFNQELEALFQLFHLAMGSHIVEHNKSQNESMDELVRGMRLLLQGGGVGVGHGGLKTVQSNDELLGDASAQESGPVAHALAAADAQTLVELFSDEAADATQAEEAARALCDLAEQDATRDAIVENGGVEALVKALQGSEAAKATVRVHTARTLRRLALRDLHEVAIVEAGAVPSLAAMIQASASEAETSAACAALANLAFQAEHKLVIVRTPELLPRLVELVRVGTPAQRKHAANTLREVARNDECAAAIADAGGITALVDLLHIGTPEQCAGALEALWNLASLQKNRTEIAAVGGINAIVAQMRRDNASDDQKQLAGSALAVLAQDDANDQLIGAAGAVELLVKALQTGTEGQKNSAAWALAELANNKDNATAMVRAGALPALIAAFRSGTDIQRAKAGLALVWIAKLTDDKAALVNEIGLHGIVSLLRGTTDQKQSAAAIIAHLTLQEAYRGEVGELETIPLLVDLVENHWPKQSGTLALRRLSYKHEGNQTKIVEAGGIPVLVDIMKKTNEGDDVVVRDTFENARDALFWVSNAASLKGKVIASGAIAELARAMVNGTTHQKKGATVLLGLLARSMEDEDSALGSDGEAAETLRLCEHAFTSVLETCNTGKKEHEEIMRQVISGLTRVVVHPRAKAEESEQRKVLLMVLDVLRSKCSALNKKNATAVLGNITLKKEAFALVLAEAGAISVFEPFLHQKSYELQFAGVYGLEVLGKTKALRAQIAAYPGVVKGCVRLMEAGAKEEIQRRAVKTIYWVTLEKEIAKELAPTHGMEALVNHVKKGTQWALSALENLSKLPENLELLAEIGAVEAANHSFTTAVAGVKLIALRLLANMSACREARSDMLSSGAVAHAVTALKSATKTWKPLGLKILTNLNGLETPDDDADSDSDSDSEDEMVKRSKSKSDDDDSDDSDDDSDDSDSDNDSSDSDDDDESSLHDQIREANGVDPLLEMLESLGSGEREKLITLLVDLVIDDDATRRKVGASLGVLVKVMREGSGGEQVEAMSAVASLVDGSKLNATAAIRARVVDAAVHVVTTADSSFRNPIKHHIRDLYKNLKGLKGTETQTAAKKLVKALTTAAVDESKERSATAFKMVSEELATKSFAKTFISVDASAICTAELDKALAAEKAALKSEQLTRVVTLLEKVAGYSKGRAQLTTAGVEDKLKQLVKHAENDAELVEACEDALTALEAAAA